METDEAQDMSQVSGEVLNEYFYKEKLKFLFIFLAQYNVFLVVNKIALGLFLKPEWELRYN